MKSYEEEYRLFVRGSPNIGTRVGRRTPRELKSRAGVALNFNARPWGKRRLIDSPTEQPVMHQLLQWLHRLHRHQAARRCERTACRIQDRQGIVPFIGYRKWFQGHIRKPLSRCPCQSLRHDLIAPLHEFRELNRFPVVERKWNLPFVIEMDRSLMHLKPASLAVRGVILALSRQLDWSILAVP